MANYCLPALLFFWASGLLAVPDDNLVSDRLRTRIEERHLHQSMEVMDADLMAKNALPRFYQACGFQPAWSANGKINPAFQQLLVAITKADREGLRPNDYHLPRLQALGERYPKEKTTALLSDLDLLATDAYLIYATHLLSGKVNPVTIDAEWHASPREMDLVAHLEKALSDNSIPESLQALLPQHPGYHRLKDRLAELRATPERSLIAIELSGVLKPGQSHAAVPEIRRRLGSDSSGGSNESLIYDPQLFQQIKAEQRQWGLDDDGMIGPNTLSVLNLTQAQQIQIVIANMERWRWLPQQLGERHIRVNIASFEAEVWAAGKLEDRYKVIVGKDFRRTPVFSAPMTYLVLAPYWHVPPKLAVQDKLPKLKKDAGSLSDEGYEIWSGWGEDSVLIDPKRVDWNAISAGRFPYRLRQKPGAKNALGKVKFMFPNRLNIYIHDTPGKELFAKANRAFSSGCIRIERPMELTRYLLRDQPDWTEARIEQVIASNVETTVRLSRPLMVHMQYWTAFVDEQGQLQWRFDLYGRDQALIQAWRAQAPDS